MGAVEVFADIACPFAHAGLVAFVDRRRRVAPRGPVLRVRAWPLELVNNRPLSAGATRTHAQDLRDQAFPHLFAALDQLVMPSTSLPAMGLVAAAYRVADGVGEEVSLAVRRALFEEGRDLSAPEVLTELAERYGLEAPSGDRESVLADWRAGQARGVRGSPHFFAGEGDWFCPSVRITPLEGHHVSVVGQPEVLDAVLEAATA